MNTKKTYYIVAVFLTVSLFSKAQNTQDNVMIFGVPQYLLKGAARIDIDIRQKNTNKWWVFTPYYYYRESEFRFFEDNYNHRFNTLVGLGLGVERKIIFGKEIKNEGFYFKYGLNYRNFRIKGNSYIYRDVVGEDGLMYKKMEEGAYTLNINSYNGLAAIGYQVGLGEKMFADVFCGFGLKYSTHSSPENVVVTYNRDRLDYGYTGTLFVGGFRLGVAL